ncbi:MAG: hypothetical protein EOP84_25220, partial [Verrucomicrobiaceae bacterium]
MFSLNRYGWFFGVAGFLAIGFALGWSSATLREPEAHPVSTPVLPKRAELKSIALSSGKGTSFSGAEDDLSEVRVKGLASESPVGLSGTLGESLSSAFRLRDYTDRLIRIREIVRTLS